MTARARWLKDVLWGLTFFGMVSIGFRLWYGLGATTHLTDALPWGLWKIMNMVAGVALGTGGFTVAFLVYVAGMKGLRPLVRPAVLIAFLAYGSSCFALFLDIGLPHRIWHPIAMWNPHSFLFEVAWCVMLYFTVTMLEIAPTVFGRLGLQQPAAWLHRATFVIVTVGITLSSLHHTSLGSLFLMTPQRLHPLWYTPRLPLHFILSAMAGGLMVVALTKLLYARWYDPGSVYAPPPATVCASDGACTATARVGPDFPMVRRVASIAAGLLAVGLIVRVADVIATGAWTFLAGATWEAWLWTLELAVGAIVPLVVLMRARWRASPHLVALAAGSAVVGLIWNRLNVGIFGYVRSAGQVYVPSLTEWGLSLGVVAAAGLVFFLAVEQLPIFDDGWLRRREGGDALTGTFERVSQVWRATLPDGLSRVTLIAVVVIPTAWVAAWPPAAVSEAEAIQSPRAMDIRRATLLIDGNGGGVATSFPHADHQRRLGGDSSCGTCHHLSWPRDHATPCSRCHTQMEHGSRVFDHERHMMLVAQRDGLRGAVRENLSCPACHTPGQPYAEATARPCLECHRTDMRPTREPRHPRPILARGFRAAMHETCVTCHTREAARQDRRQLGECSWCHESLRARPQGEGPVPARLARSSGDRAPGS